MGIGIIIGLIVFILILLVTNIRIVPQSEAYIMERLG